LNKGPAGKNCPRITIVTPSLNQAQFIEETIKSVLAQDYPDLEHIVVDGLSTDGTLDILKRYPHLTVISERDEGQPDAINKGFRLATGEVWGYLNSDDTLLPGALKRVADEIDPRAGRHVVMGRCRFTDERGRYIGIEHPSHFESHARVLQVWKGYSIPQPAVFWTPDVWHSCGPMRDTGYQWLDYDLFCRFSRRYRFHQIDQVLATYRLHEQSKTSRYDEYARLRQAVAISRLYWGSPFKPLYWRMVLSLAAYRFGRTRWSFSLLSRARNDWRRQRWGTAILLGLAGLCIGPDVALEAVAYPIMRDGAQSLAERAALALSRRRGVYLETAVYRDHTDLWEDGWAGPVLRASKSASWQAGRLTLKGWTDLRYLGKPLGLTIRVNDHVLGKYVVESTGEFSVRLPLPTDSRGDCCVEVEADNWFVPHRFSGTGDYRPLAWQVRQLAIE